MAIKSKIIYYDRTYAQFKVDSYGLNGATTKDTDGNWGSIPNNAVVFLGDGNIWTHGQLIKGVTDTNLSNYVTLNTNQTITGSKIFNSETYFISPHKKFVLVGYNKFIADAAKKLSLYFYPEGKEDTYSENQWKIFLGEWISDTTGHIDQLIIVPKKYNNILIDGYYTSIEGVISILNQEGFEIRNADIIYGRHNIENKLDLHTLKIGHLGIKPIVHRSIPRHPRKGNIYYFTDRLKIATDNPYENSWYLDSKFCGSGLYEIIMDGDLISDISTRKLNPMIIRRLSYDGPLNLETKSPNFIIENGKIKCIAIPDIKNFGKFIKKGNNWYAMSKHLHTNLRGKAKWRKNKGSNSSINMICHDRLHRIYGGCRNKFLSNNYITITGINYSFEDSKCHGHKVL